MRLAEFCRYWDPSRVCELKPDYNKLILFANIIYGVDELKMKALAAETIYYMELAKDVVFDKKLLSQEAEQFFARHCADIPTYFEVYRLIALHQPSNCCSERLHSVFRQLDFNSNALESTIECATICRFNHRTE